MEIPLSHLIILRKLNDEKVGERPHSTTYVADLGNAYLNHSIDSAFKECLLKHRSTDAL